MNIVADTVKGHHPRHRQDDTYVPVGSAVAFRDSGSSTWGDGVGTLSAHDAKDGYCAGLIARSLRTDSFDASDDGSERQNTIAYQQHGSDIGPMGTLRRGNGDVQSGVPFVVNAALSGAKQSHAHESETARCLDSTGSFANAQGGTVVSCDFRNMTEGDISITIQSGPHGEGPGITPHVRLNCGVRRLTPRECERLQGLPDDWTFVPWRGGIATDGPRYKAIGNSFAVPVVRWIGRRIMEVDQCQP